MKILIYGAGVIGCTYGWQLSEAECDITVLVRSEKKEYIAENGFNIHCSDFRTGKEHINDIIFRPKAIDTLSAENDFDYIIVSTNSLHLHEVLSTLKESTGKAHIIFFQNLWISDFDKISDYLSAEQYFFGFPFMAGGGRNGNKINSIISGSKYSKTMLGEVDGQVSERIRKISSALEKANMKPFVSEEIKAWLVPHYAFIANISYGIIKAGGSMKTFLSRKDIIKETVLAIRESFDVCKQAGFDPKKEKVNKLYYMPLLIYIPVIRKIFSDKSMAMMFEGYLENASDEIKEMKMNITTCREELNRR